MRVLRLFERRLRLSLSILPLSLVRPDKARSRCVDLLSLLHHLYVLVVVVVVVVV
jgi:hypothetical protein